MRPWRGLAGLFALLLAAAVPTIPAAVRAAEVPLIAAASDLRFALPEIAEEFARKSGRRVRLTFGSSGNFSRQIRQHAPFEIFFSADRRYVRELHEEGFLRDAGKTYAIGRLVLIVPLGSPLAADGSLADLKRALSEGRVAKFAIANPEHAPYGARAREALRNAGLWEAIRDRLVLGENVAQAAQFATSGNAEGGIIAYALALAPEIAARTRHALIPADLHAPLHQVMALTRNAGPTAEAFFAFAGSQTARAIFRKYGFLLPGEAS